MADRTRLVAGLLLATLGALSACVDDSAGTSAVDQNQQAASASTLAGNETVALDPPRYREVERTLMEMEFELGATAPQRTFAVPLDLEATSVVMVLEITQSISRAFEAHGSGTCGWEFPVADTQTGAWNRFDASEILVGTGMYMSDRDCGPNDAGELAFGARIETGRLVGKLTVEAIVLEPDA